MKKPSELTQQFSQQDDKAWIRRGQLWALCQVLTDPSGPHPWEDNPVALERYIIDILSCGQVAEWVLVPDPPLTPSRATYSCTRHLPLMVNAETQEAMRCCCTGDEDPDDIQTCMYVPHLMGLPESP